MTLFQEQAGAGGGASPVGDVPFLSKALGLLLERLEEMGGTLVRSLPNVLIALLLVWLTGKAAKLARRLIQRGLRSRPLRPSLKDLFQNIAHTSVWVVGLLVTAAVVVPSLSFGGVVATLGLGSVAIGFAFKDVFENFLAGILILLRDPMEIGDFIHCEGNEGRIESITIRDTMIRQSDGQHVILPNSFLFKNPVRIITHERKRRMSITAGVAYGEDVDRSREVIREAVRSCDSVSKDHPLEIYAKEFASSSIDFEVSWWSDPKPGDERLSRDQVVAAVKRGLDEAGIEIPFPYRTLTFKHPLEVHRGEAGDGREDG